MEKDLDKKLYNDYLGGNKDALECLYNKYKHRIQYFVFNIIKDYQKAEDITQETFIYIIQNRIKEDISFKYYVYMIAKSKAMNYVNVENRRKEISREYCFDDEVVEKDVLEIITKQETRKEVLEAIKLLDEKYRNAVYLTKIEELSYEETSKILGQNLQNTKNLIHRGKKELRKILLKKGFDNMNKVSKMLVIVLGTIVVLSGTIWAITAIYNTTGNITMNPTYQGTIDENTANNLWVGTLDLAWKELKDRLGLNRIEVEGNELQIVNNLNNSVFSKEMLNKKDYKINVERTETDGYKIETKLMKKLNFLEKFDNFSDYYRKWTFGNSEDYIKYFGINNASSEAMNKNIEVLFYNKISESNLQSNDFAIKLKTKEGDEIILYRTDENKTFIEYYDEILEKTEKYTGSKEFLEDDELKIPYVKLNGVIQYNELYGKEIKNTNGLYLYEVIQDADFALNESGCNLSSQSTVITEYESINFETRYCFFKDTFVIFMKEASADMPYFALKVDNSDILEKIEEN